MMLDTLKAVDTLKSNGFEDKQARAIAAVVTHTNDELATKQDIKAIKKDIELSRAEMHTQNTELRAEMQAQNAELRAEMQAQHAELRAEMQAQNTEVRAEMQAQNTEVRAEITELRAEMQAQNTALRASDDALKSSINTLRWMVGILYPLIVGALIALFF